MSEWIRVRQSPVDARRDKHAAVVAVGRRKLRDVHIPEPLNIERRLACLSNPELLLKTYFASVFAQPFTQDRSAMLQAIIDAAIYGGDQSIAGPRGEGKSRLAIYGSLVLMLTGLSHFPIVIGKSQSKAQSDLKTIREQLQQNDLFIADFPEIGVPFQRVGGWSSRARLQTVNGVLTNIEIAPDHFIFPKLTMGQLGWECECDPISNGQIMACLGIDGPIRGTNIRDQRPTLAIIDDIENRESVNSDILIAKNEEIIEADIGGLGQSGKRISRVLLCTTQNRKCIAYRYTDPKIKPSWRGKRYRKLVKQPDRIDLVTQYIEMRQSRSADDPDAREAFRFWRDNQSTIENGSQVSNPFAFDDRLHADGEPLELSAVHAYYNQVADRGQKAVSTEDDNDPPEEAGPQTSGITSEMIMGRLSGLERGQLPANTMCLTAGIDLGKYRCHWTITAWWRGGGGVVVDYGVAEVVGTETEMTKEASEPAIFRALLAWRDELLRREFVDATGTNRKVDAVFIDSGDFSDAAYEFVRQVGGSPFYCSKGMNPYRQPRESKAGTKVHSHLHSAHQPDQRIWLYHLDTDYWKSFIHERFLTPTFDENNMLTTAALSLFDPIKARKHLSFSQHIVAEEYVTEFTEGKGTKTYWRPVNQNNHWLDATCYAAAAAGALGVSLLQPVELEPRQVSTESKQKPKPVPQVRQHGFRQRPGGWINGARRRY